VAPTNGIIAVMFGTRFRASLQVGFAPAKRLQRPESRHGECCG
jgi:hypothetical protein